MAGQEPGQVIMRYAAIPVAGLRLSVLGSVAWLSHNRLIWALSLHCAFLSYDADNTTLSCVPKPAAHRGR